MSTTALLTIAFILAVAGALLAYVRRRRPRSKRSSAPQEKQWTDRPASAPATVVETALLPDELTALQQDAPHSVLVWQDTQFGIDAAARLEAERQAEEIVRREEEAIAAAARAEQERIAAEMKASEAELADLFVIKKKDELAEDIRWDAKARTAPTPAPPSGSDTGKLVRPGSAAGPEAGRRRFDTASLDAALSTDEAAAKAARLEAQRVAAADAARIKAERAAAALAELARRENARIAALEAQRLEELRIAAEDAAMLEAERVAADDAARVEAERIAAAHVRAERVEAERRAALEAARLEVLRLKAEEQAHEEAARRAAEEAIRQEAARLLAEEAARAQAARQAVLDAERAVAERIEAENEARLAAERAAAAEVERLEAARLAAVEAKWITAAAWRNAAAEKERAAQEEIKQAAARRRFAEIAAKARTPAVTAAPERAPEPERVPEAQPPVQPTAPVVVPAVAPAAAPTTAPSPRVQKSAADTVIMIADDSKVVRIKTNRLLGNNQFQVQQAEDGLDAMRQIAERMPDILITDVEMPGMDGFELTRHVRGSPLTAHIPIIMITAGEHEDKAAEAGVDILLGKPYPEDVLIAHIQRLMRDGRSSAAT